MLLDRPRSALTLGEVEEFSLEIKRLVTGANALKHFNPFGSISVALIMRAQRYAEHTHVALVPAHDDVEAPAPAGYVIDRSHGLCRNQRMHNRNMNGDRKSTRLNSNN